MSVFRQTVRFLLPPTPSTSPDRELESRKHRGDSRESAEPLDMELSSIHLEVQLEKLWLITTQKGGRSRKEIFLLKKYLHQYLIPAEVFPFVPKRSSLSWVLCAALSNRSSFHLMTYVIQRDSYGNQEESMGAHPLNCLLDSTATSDTLRDPYEGLQDPLHHEAFLYGPVPPILWPIKTK